MSNLFRMNPGGIQVFQDSSENAGNMATRKVKGEEGAGRQPAIKRSALGTITNQTRVQPSRAAKQSNNELSCQENIPPAEGVGQNPALEGPPPQPFSIHVDNEVSCQILTDISAKNLGLHLHTSIQQIRQPFQLNHDVIEVQDSPQVVSPMCMDTSLDASNIDQSSESRLAKLLSVDEYANEIYTYLRQAELKHRPKPGYIRKQPDVTSSMRSILIDWLIEVAEEYKLHRETIFLAVNYIDRFLSQMSVLRGKLQLVGAAATFLAAKYEEIYPPEVGEFVYITDDTYTAKQVLRMEHLVLKVLSFNVAVPTTNCFCEKFLKDCDASDQTKSLTMFLAEQTLVEADTYLKYLPSIIAAAAVYLARHTLFLEAWPQRLADQTGYQVSDFEDCLQELHQTHISAKDAPQQAIREKYKQDKYHRVSCISPAATLPGGMLV